MEFHIKALEHLVKVAFLEGLILIISGTLIFIFPDLLGMIVGIGLILSGLVAISFAAKISKYSSIKL